MDRYDPIVAGRDLRATKQDLRIIRRAIVGGWNVPEDVKSRLVAKMADILGDEDPRSVIAAGKVLVACDANDLRAEIAYNQQPATINVTTVATSVNAPEPTTNAARLDEVMALLDAARARAACAAEGDSPGADAVR